MDAVIFYIAVFVFLIFVAPIWALVRATRARRASVELRKDLDKANERIYALHKQVLKLEEQLKEISGRPLAPAGEVHPAGAPKAEPLAPPPVSPPSAPVPPAAVAPPVSPKPSVPSPPDVPPPTPTPPPVTPVPPPSKVQPATPPPSAAGVPPPPSPPRPTARPIPPPPPPPAPRAGLFQRPPGGRRWGDIEEILGTNWLPKIGIGVLVIGLGLLLNYFVPQMSKEVRVALVYLFCAMLLGLGVLGERRENYVILGRVLIGGGWAATYATTFAIHNWDAVKLVRDPTVGFVLLFVVAVGMVGHSLRYNSQLVTGLAYMLGFATIVLGYITLGTMIGSALLTASVVVVLWRKKWYAFEPLALVAVYGVHWLWVRQIFEDLGGKKPFADSTASVLLLTIYWVLFTVSYFLRDEEEPAQRQSLAATLLLNAAGYLGVMGYQALYPHLRFYFLVGLGAVYLALAVVSRRIHRQLGFLLTSTLGSALVMVGFYYKYTGASLELLWLAEAQVLLFVGWRTADAHFRRLGWAAAAVVVPYIALHHLTPRWSQPQPPSATLGWLLLAMAVIYLANARLAPRLLRKEVTEVDSLAAQVAAPVGAALLLAAAWVAIPFLWVAVAWAAVALLLREYGHRADDDILRICGYSAAFAAVLRLFVVNLSFEPARGASNLHFWAFAAPVALLYLTAWRLRAAEPPLRDANLAKEFFGWGPSAVHAWAATLPIVPLVAVHEQLRPAHLTWVMLALAAVAVLVSYPIALAYVMAAAWLALPYMWVALVWTALGVTVGELGLRRNHRVLRACGHLAALLALVRLVSVNMWYAPTLAGVSLRLVTVALSVALYYIFARRITLKREPEREVPLLGDIVWRGTLQPMYTVAGTLLATLLIWKEVNNTAVGLTWAMFGLALIEVARWREDKPLRVQGYTLLVLSFARIFFADLNAADELWRVGGIMVTPRLLTVTALTVIYYYSARTAEDDVPRMRTALYWFGTTAFAALMRFELATAWVAAGWAVMVVALYFAARRLQLATLRYQAYLLSVLVAARCALDNFANTAPLWGTSGPNVRTVTVGIASLVLFALLAPSLGEKRRRAADGSAPPAEAAGFWPRWAGRCDRNAHHLYFFLPTLLLTALLTLEFYQRVSLRSYLTAAWGIEGLLVFILGLGLGERAFRRFGLLLLLASIAKVGLVDWRSYSDLGKIVSFLALGVVLLVVSFLYTRFRETWKKYL